MNSLFAFLQHNQLVQGGLFLGIIGGALAYLRNVPMMLFRNVQNRLLHSVTVTNDEDAYNWLEYWAFKHFSDKPRTKSFRLATEWMDGECITVFIPSPGQYAVRYKKAWLWVSLLQEKLEKAGTESLFLKTITVRALRGNRALLEEFVADAKKLHKERHQNKLRVFVEDSYGSGWRAQKAREPRPLDSVVLASGTAHDIIADVERFRGAKIWYQERGIPRRRGYLLYGEPGNGKTSLIIAIATALHQNIAVLSLSAGGMNDQRLTYLLSNPPEDCILCIEDIDAAFNQREKTEETKLSFSGLLNALDGISSSEERVLFMTTNFKERLDPALIRPGRADRHVYIGNATKDQARRLFLRFFPNEEVLAERFVCQFRECSVSMATLQELFLAAPTAADAVTAGASLDIPLETEVH